MLVGQVIAVVEEQPSPTIRHVNCLYLIKPSLHTTRCQPCAQYRGSLRVFASRQKNQYQCNHHSSHSNYSHMNSEVKHSLIKSLKAVNKEAEMRISFLEKQVAQLTEQASFEINENLH